MKNRLFVILAVVLCAAMLCSGALANENAAAYLKEYFGVSFDGEVTAEAYNAALTAMDSKPLDGETFTLADAVIGAVRLAGMEEMAKALEWNMKEETVLLPADLYRRHDEAATELALRNARERAESLKQEREMALAAIQPRAEKYNFEMDDYIIRVAECAGDIRLEGETLEHCVGGYAERHMAGKTTILFLRRKAAPDASLYTIEMDGNILRQIHGFRNERNGAPDPRKTMAWMIDPWLSWLKKGSPRNEDGSPKLPKKKEKENNAA